jgi:hypothetical protein
MCAFMSVVDLNLSKTIPIFIFSYSTASPILLDKYYQSKALVDMVFATQCRSTQYRSRVMCNGEYVMWNLRDPTRSLIASTALLLGGVIPKHISYSHERRAAVQVGVCMCVCAFLFAVPSSACFVFL